MIADGQLLEQMVSTIVVPPTLWNALVKFFLNGQMDEQSLYPFAWLAHEMLSSSSSLYTDLVSDIEAISKNGRLSSSESHQTRELAYKLAKTLQLKHAPMSTNHSTGTSPGGRHDNDFADFRQVAVYPTRDELLSKERPFYQCADDVLGADHNIRLSMHLDNQYRLLREDMLVDIRNNLQIALGKKKSGRRSAIVLGCLDPDSIRIGDKSRWKRCSTAFRCYEGLEELRKLDEDKSRSFLRENQNYLKHQAFGALCQGNEMIGFAFVDRDVDLLVKKPATICLQFTDGRAQAETLVAVKLTRDVRFILINTPVFAYEPILKQLKVINDHPLYSTILEPSGIGPNTTTSFKPHAALEAFSNDLRSKSDATGSVRLKGTTPSIDKSQRDSLTNALTNAVSVIQGPPGTGKTFIGSQIVRCMHSLTNLRVLVITYTNHALDQFLEYLLDVGIPFGSMTRLGSKSTLRTSSLLLSKQEITKMTRERWAIVDRLKEGREEIAEELKEAFDTYLRPSHSFSTLMEHLEFSSHDRHFYDAFLLPSEEDDWKRVGKKGVQVKPDYLYSQWRLGEGPGIFSKQIRPECKCVWDMTREARQDRFSRWMSAIIRSQVDEVANMVLQADKIHEQREAIFEENKVGLLQSKRVIGCTTTAAAMFSNLIRAAEPDVVLVEEAGEILESHILASIAPSVKQLILIGDHKQLRPKINNYALTVEKGDGYNLNMSLFERLVVQGFTYSTLQKQHRMRPEISIFPRELSYPDLVDGESTLSRERILGIRDTIIFIDHEHPESSVTSISDRREPGSTASKENLFEAMMVLKVVKYLAQQGYGTNRLVVLTPYLGQLRLLREKLKVENDPILNDLDASELIQAGLMTQAASKVSKRPLRLSTIDNYQGEESKIVIASLTRSNEAGDIGFMSAAERLNVLITRAKDCLIIIGNMETFKKSKRGGSTWLPFFELLKANGHLYDGLPINCEQHPDRTSLLKTPSDFDASCPDGGCAQPCGALLKCRSHSCNRKCHRLQDHSQVECTHMLEKCCDRGHKTRVKCSKKHLQCVRCKDEDKAQERRIKRDLELEKQRLAREKSYAAELQQLEDDLDLQRRKLRYRSEEEEQKKTLSSRREELGALKGTVLRMQQQEEEKSRRMTATKNTDTSKGTQASGAGDPKTEKVLFSKAREDWLYCKENEHASSPALDELMEMIGLEEVKTAFLEIKSTVDTKMRQNVSLASQRFGCSLLGNPGTGKTTVARLYAKFLSSIGVIPGSHFEETTGSKLANLGVSGCQNLVDTILNDGGGVIFIDEAYQLTSGNNPGGGGVLDFLLAEVENLTGKIVFILAGYSKQMESFFSHNPGLPSRFPIEMKFVDYTDEELLAILKLKIEKQYGGSMKCDDGLLGLFCRIVARRIGRGRGREGFGNARTVENALALIQRRQSVRLSRERRSGMNPDDFQLSKEDLIGPEPSEALAKSTGWQRLQQLTGLAAVKQAIQSLVDSVQQNYRRELTEQPPIEYSLNKVFLGNPGTGKTTVAKLYGQILVDLGLLSKGEVLVKNPSDFVGSALGQSEQLTKGILAAATGKVLVIDEAYGLYGGGGSQGAASDPYKTSVIDTIVAEVQSVPGDDRCVLLLGYKDQMEKMFQNVNPGLSRRFPIASAFTFDDFSGDELRQILELKLKQQGFEATGQAKNVAMEMLDRARNRPHFGNAGEVDILLDKAKQTHQTRFSSGLKQSATRLEALDFDEHFDRAEQAETNVRKLFGNTVGAEEVISRLEGYQETVRNVKAIGLDPKDHVPFNFVFSGPPGTGKTTTARRMGKVFYDMGFLSTAEVVECSATDLVGQYVGQTGPKVQQQLDKALGKVLFVDEAYRLSEGAYAKEAVDELVDSVTKLKYHRKLVIILAGYTADMERLLSVNEGLTSRFPEVINFRNFLPEEGIALLSKLLAVQKAALERKGSTLDIKVQGFSATLPSELSVLFEALSSQKSWANARDIETLGKRVFHRAIKSGGGTKQLFVDDDMVISELASLLGQRQERDALSLVKVKTPDKRVQEQALATSCQETERQTIRSTTSTVNEAANETDTPEIPVMKPKQSQSQMNKQHQSKDKILRPKRDHGVSDEVWEQLQRDMKAEQDREQKYRDLVIFANNARDANRDRLVQMLIEEEERREEEKRMKEKLRAMGACPAGFDWIKQENGYRCTAGGHFIANEQL